MAGVGNGPPLSTAVARGAAAIVCGRVAAAPAEERLAGLAAAAAPVVAAAAAGVLPLLCRRLTNAPNGSSSSNASAPSPFEVDVDVFVVAVVVLSGFLTPAEPPPPPAGALRKAPLSRADSLSPSRSARDAVISVGGRLPALLLGVGVGAPPKAVVVDDEGGDDVPNAPPLTAGPSGGGEAGR